MDKRICVILDDEVYQKLRLYQAKLIKNNHGSCSFSKVINHVLRVHFS